MSLNRFLVIISVLLALITPSQAASKKKSTKTSNEVPQITRQLSYRSTNHSQVKILQLALTKAGYVPGPIDGIYARQVQTAMQKLQSDLHLVADGCYVGKNSRAFLNAVLKGKDTRGMLKAIAVQAPVGSRCFAASILKDPDVRTTAYWKHERGGDRDTNAGRSSTGVRLRFATSSQIGIGACDPEIIRQGSLVETVQGNQVLRYVLGDTGGGVTNQTASKGTAPIIDLFAKTEYKGRIRIIPYTGATPFLQLPLSEKMALLNFNNWKTGKFRSPVKVMMRVASL